MVIDTLLQLSWLRPLSSKRTVRPDHEPTPVPDGTTLAPEAPPIAKSACVQSGLVASTVCEANARTAAVTELMLTGPGFGFVNVPASAAAGPPGYSPLGAPVWLTVIADVVPADAAPDPL